MWRLRSRCAAKTDELRRQCFGVSISYLIILGSLLPRITHSFAGGDDSVPAFLLDRRWWIAICMVVLAPISFLRTLHALRFTSYVALIAVIDLLFVVIYKVRVLPRSD